MKSFLFFICFLPCSCKAQKTYTIVYSFPEKKDTVRFGGREIIIPEFLTKMVLNDSFTFNYSYRKGNDPLSKSRKAYGETLVPHGQYYDKVSGKVYGSGHASPKLARYLYPQSIVSHKWIESDTTKIIMGYLCKARFYVDGNRDSILIYYTHELMEQGILYPNRYAGIPGVSLEIFDQHLKMHLIATDIRETDKKIKLPKNVEIITAEEVQIRNKKLRARAQGPGIWIL